ncbi:putative uncharacterized protein [Megasphaera elsdenii CAG:570]|jgi:hypothetical protein|uniref:DUF1828 domain-containing protein n=1 Tax=Megasphaera elsdenii CAG:570 TaxID=1263087 RepID=R7MUS3_MEGEL|nr:DUF1828 domain-containing protein [Megasphaera elsdenii]MBM6701729.1 DUF1828 domain-containing protein [Megasphaera elsdenii]CDF04924.1 putative uncharacterized protein [Megasphaera elsdenii CAG:570]DAL67276.1 MAG TPA: protein of unknown function DUF1829 [Caudoviricetes sp.]
MDTNFDWIAEYYQWIKKNLSARRLKNGWTEIGTPFMDRHNDGLVIYAKRDGDSITLSDDGYIINDLIADGVSLRGSKRAAFLNGLLFSYGVENQDNEMVMRTTPKNYAVSMHMFIQAMLAVNDMFMLNNATIKTIFLDDVANYFDQQGLIYTPNFLAKGSTGLEFNFNFQIAGRTSEILINSFNSINRGNLAAFLFDWQDIRDERQKRSRKKVKGLAIINDEKEVDRKYLDALIAKGTDYILFSERLKPENLQKLTAA